MIFQIISLFIIGIVENFLSALNIKFLQRNKRTKCFVVSFASIFIWIYIISTMVESLFKFYLVISYALGFAFGDVLAIQFNAYLETIAKAKNLKLRIKRNVKRQKKKR